MKIAEEATIRGVSFGLAVRLGEWRRLAAKKPLGAVGAFLILSLVFTAIFASVLMPYDPYALSIPEAFQAPGTGGHLFGTDELGRDLLSRIIWGSRISLAVALFSVGIGQSIGLFLGLISAYYLGKTDMLIQRGIEIMMAFPSLILALAIVAALGASIANVILAISITLIPRTARVMRSAGLGVKNMMYIDAAISMGCTTTQILVRHMLPNCTAPFIILVTSSFGGVILTEATLSFLGVGTPPPEPSWGLMLSGSAQTYLTKAPWMAIFPGIAISLCVYGFNLLGDALRDVWDPKLRGR